MPPIPPNKLLELALSRRKLFEKIVQHVASRKIQNQIQATGDRMSVTPQQFGMQLGQQVKKAFNMQPAMNAVRGLGIQAGRAGLRLATAATPLVDEIGSMANTGMQRLGQTMFGTPGRAALSGAGLATAAGAYGDHIVSQAANPMGAQLMRSKLPNYMPGMGGQMPEMQHMDTLTPQMPNMNQTGLPQWSGYGQGGIAGSDDPYSMKLAQTKNTTMHKHSFITLPAMGAGAGIGAVTSPEGHRLEGATRGAAKGSGAMMGSLLGIAPGIAAVAALLRGRTPPRVLAGSIRAAARGLTPKQFPTGSPGSARRSAENAAKALLSLSLGAPAGAAVGGGLGYAGTSALIGKPSWEGKKASVLSVLGGLAGGGLGGLAGGAGGGILGALGGGALGGGPGAGLGLLAGGAAGLGAGAHMGGNIGASIGAGFSKKKEKPKSDEKEEKSEEKSEDSGDEEVKKSAAAVLAQLQKNAADPAAYSRVFGKGKGQEMTNRRQGMAQQAQQLRAANPGATTMSGTFQQGKLMPQPAAPVAPQTPVAPAAPQPKKSVTSDEAADFF